MIQIFVFPFPSQQAPSCTLQTSQTSEVLDTILTRH